MAYVSTIAQRQYSYFNAGGFATMELGYYTNNTGAPQFINSMSCYVGVGKSGTLFSAGDDVRGTGTPLTFCIDCNGVKSASVTVSNTVRSLPGTYGYYPDRRDCKLVTLTFVNLIVQPGATVWFNWTRVTSGNVFIFDYGKESVATSTASYTVSYNANGGTNAPASQTKQAGVSLTLTTSTPTGPSVSLTFDANGGSVNPSSASYRKPFKNWNTVANGSGTSYSSGGSYTTNANVTLYAQYSAATVTNLPTPTRTGYNFDGWFGSNNVQMSNGSTINSNTTVTAKWIADTYTVSYNANGGTGAPTSQLKYNDVPLTLTSSVPSKSISVTFNANGGSVSPSTKSAQCPFIRWNTAANGLGTNYNSGSTYTANAAATLYAQWSKATIGELPTPTRSNCEFVGWYTAVNGGNKVQSTTTSASNITAYARWDYVIKYDLNGGTVGEGSEGEGSATITNQIKHHQVDLVLTSIRPNKQGLVFVGWSESKSASTATYLPEGKFTKDAPVTLYAVYEVPSYKVTFDLAGGTYQGGGALVQTVSYGKSATLPNDPIKDDGEFRGWIGDHTNIIQDTIIVAMWNHCPIWIRKNDGQWHSYLENKGG